MLSTKSDKMLFLGFSLIQEFRVTFGILESLNGASLEHDHVIIQIEGS
jgi:hypothetical protein